MSLRARILLLIVVGVFEWVGMGQSLVLDTNDSDSIKRAISAACDNAMLFYHGNLPGNTPGLLDPPYCWWETGALFGLLIQRWSITGNTSLNAIITEGMQFQIGENSNFEPANQTIAMGNDDQVFWALAAMDAAEFGFPDPPPNQPSWAALAQAVFNRQSNRWDAATCGGGMRWQTFPFNLGYEYKNTITNGGYFELAARLARYTGNATYAEHAEKIYNWVVSSAIFENTTSGLRIWDGIHIANCSGPERSLWTYNTATFLMGAAYLYNYTDGSKTWFNRLDTLLSALDVFFVSDLSENGAQSQNATSNGDILSEVSCEQPTPQVCDPDQPSFKAYTSRWLAMTTVLAPFTTSKIRPRLVASAKGAAAQCTGNGPNQPAGTSCGRRWYQKTWDGYSGVGEHMSAMSIFQNLLVGEAKPPRTIRSGATSKGDAGAGSSPPIVESSVLTAPIFIRDKIGAAILTVVYCGFSLMLTTWMIKD